MIARMFAFLMLAACAMVTRGNAEDGTLPSRDPGVVIPLLRDGTAHRDLHRVELILGAPDEAFISGFRIYVFRLDDATSVYVATRDRDRIFSIRRSASGVDATTLYDPLGEALRRPAPRSAPF